jgi:dephospho-CoA kinase
MLKVALTGGVATGKSYVRARIAARGVPTADADAIVHELLAAGSEVSVEITSRFGGGVALSGGGVNRRALGALVFADAAARRDLEAIVHPRVYERIAHWMALQAQGGVPWVLADIPLVFETGRDADFDRVVVAACAPEEQVRRLVRRDGLDADGAAARIAAQWPIEDKVRRATDVIDTSGTFAETDRQVDAICRVLDEAAGRGSGVRVR